MLTEIEFQQLLHTFHRKQEDFFTQINHYFDTKSFSLQQKGAALRIRELPNKYELTLKLPAEIGLLEINDPLNENQVNSLLHQSLFPDGEVRNELEKMNIATNDLHLIGSLSTNRSECEYDEGLLVFDHSFYLGIEDYEIEYETDDFEKGNNTFQQLLTQCNIKREPAVSKIGRLYNEKKKVKKDE